MSHGKQLSYRKQQPATLSTNQKVPNPTVVSQRKGCPPLALQTPAELDHLLKHPLSARAGQQTDRLIVPTGHKSLPGLAQGEYKVFADLAFM